MGHENWDLAKLDVAKGIKNWVDVHFQSLVANSNKPKLYALEVVNHSCWLISISSHCFFLARCCQWKSCQSLSADRDPPGVPLELQSFQDSVSPAMCLVLPWHLGITWGWVKTLVPSEPQNSWVKMDVHPTKNGINRY